MMIIETCRKTTRSRPAKATAASRAVRIVKRTKQKNRVTTYQSILWRAPIVQTFQPVKQDLLSCLRRRRFER
jgi:hypothetical protein